MRIDTEHARERIAFVLSAVLAFLVLTWFVVGRLDPDFGWRLRYGEMILKSGFPTGDPFSYTVPSFPFVSHAWLYDISLAWLFPRVGFWGLSALAAVLTVFTLALVTRPLARTCTRVVLMLLSPAILVPFIGVRAQVAAWPLVGIAYLMATLPSPSWKKWRYLLPLFALAWANIHGSLPLLFLFIGARIVADTYNYKKPDSIDLALFMVSLGATLINPYGTELWREIARTTFDTSLRGSVIEWRSPFGGIPFYPFLGATILFPLCCALLVLDKSQERLVRVLLFAGTSVMAAMYARHLAPWLFCALGCLSSFRGQGKELLEGAGNDPGLRSLRLPVLGFALILLIVPYATSGLFHTSSFEERRLAPYPADAVSWIHAHPVPRQLFSSYNYGGFLIWQNPDYKVFTDGRMPSWRWDAPPGESAAPFLEWRAITRGDQEVFEGAVAKYGIRSALYPTGTRGAAFARIMENLHWTKVYEDGTSAVWVAPTS